MRKIERSQKYNTFLSVNYGKQIIILISLRNGKLLFEFKRDINGRLLGMLGDKSRYKSQLGCLLRQVGGLYEQTLWVHRCSILSHLNSKQLSTEKSRERPFDLASGKTRQEKKKKIEPRTNEKFVEFGLTASQMVLISISKKCFYSAVRILRSLNVAVFFRHWRSRRSSFVRSVRLARSLLIFMTRRLTACWCFLGPFLSKTCASFSDCSSSDDCAP